MIEVLNLSSRCQKRWQSLQVHINIHSNARADMHSKSFYITLTFLHIPGLSATYLFNKKLSIGAKRTDDIQNVQVRVNQINSFLASANESAMQLQLRRRVGSPFRDESACLVVVKTTKGDIWWTDTMNTPRHNRFVVRPLFVEGQFLIPRPHKVYPPPHETPLFFVRRYFVLRMRKLWS